MPDESRARIAAFGDEFIAIHRRLRAGPALPAEAGSAEDLLGLPGAEG